MVDNITLPSVHGGHCSIDNHRPYFSGFDPKLADNNPFLPEVCPTCPGREWCYNLRRPNYFEDQVVNLRAIYHCYQETARRQNIYPFCVTVHSPFPPALEMVYEKHYGKPFYEVKTRMPLEDFPIFLAATMALDYKAVEFDILFEPFRKEADKLIEEVASGSPSIIRIGSLHHLQIEGELVRQGKIEEEKTRQIYQRVGRDYFWRVVLQATLEAVESMNIQVLAHPFCWHKRLPDQCPVNPNTKYLVMTIAQVLAKRKIFIDLNTSGFGKGNFRDNPYLPIEWLPIFMAQNCYFTCGDDSHNQRQVGQYYDQLLSFLNKNGIKEIWRPKAVDLIQPPAWEVVSLL